MTVGIQEYLKRHSCYDVLSVSFKQTMLDMDLSLKKSLLVMLQNGITCAPVWDSLTQSIGCCLVTMDFVRMIMSFYERNVSLDEALKQIEHSSIRDLLNMNNVLLYSPEFMSSVCAGADDSLLDSAKAMVTENVDNLLVMTSPNDMLTLIDHNRIIKFLAVNYTYDESMNKSISDIDGLVKVEDLITVTPDTPLIRVLKYFIDFSISAVPVVDESKTILDVCDVVDFINLIPSGVYMHLDMPVSEMLAQRGQPNTFIPTCKRQTPIKNLLETIRTTSSYCIPRFYIVDSPENRKLQGIISIHELLRYLISADK